MLPKRTLVDIKINKLPHFVENENNMKYGTPDSICFDICAAIDESITLFPGERATIPTGFRLIGPNPIWYRINSRSGLASKFGIISVGGIIDNDYRGEFKVIMVNTNSSNPRDGKAEDYAYTIHRGDKIAQVEIPFPYQANFIEVSTEEYDQDKTNRTGGFGSTGK